MKKQLRLILGKVYRVPVIGYLLEMLVIAIRLPSFRARVRKLEGKLSRPDYDVSSDNLSDHVAAFRQHLPAFVSAIGSVRELSDQVERLRTSTQALEAAVHERDERIRLLEQTIAETRVRERGPGAADRV
jgi:hypothetical protein